MADTVENALSIADMMEQAKKKGNLKGVPPESKEQFFVFIIFRLTFHRDFDHRRYQITRIAWVGRDSKTGKAIVWDSEMVSMVSGLMEQMVKSLQGKRLKR